ncbi:uncharacterized protein LOC120825399 [Gasterosteus aculeatus]
MENYSYFFFHRMDENYNIPPPTASTFRTPSSPTSDNRPTFSSLFQFSNSTQGSHSFHVFSPEWGTPEDNRGASCSHLHRNQEQANATEPDFKSKDWVFLNYTQGCSGGQKQKNTDVWPATVKPSEQRTRSRPRETHQTAVSSRQTGCCVKQRLATGQ